jgi:tRNA nucleotidyltransferase (CCA-adding enzyme)
LNSNFKDFSPFILLRKIEQLTNLRVFIVGGFVRDILLGYPPEDADYLICGENAIGKFLLYFPEAFLVNKKHMIYRFGRYDIGFTHNKDTVSVEQYGDLQLRDELIERDFTANTVLIDSLGLYTDYFGGIEDIKNKQLKPVRIKNILEHGVRIIRGARLAATRDLELCISIADILEANFSGVNEENFIYELKKAEKAGVRDKFIKIIIDREIYKKIDPNQKKILQALDGEEITNHF